MEDRRGEELGNNMRGRGETEKCVCVWPGGRPGVCVCTAIYVIFFTEKQTRQKNKIWKERSVQSHRSMIESVLFPWVSAVLIEVYFCRNGPNQ